MIGEKINVNLRRFNQSMIYKKVCLLNLVKLYVLVSQDSFEISTC